MFSGTASSWSFNISASLMLTELHLKGYISSRYIDDLYLQGKNYDACVHNVIEPVIQIDTLGLVTHPDKSVFNPTQQLVILGFVLNSVNIGEQVWRSGESTRLPPMWPRFDSRTRRHKWVEFVLVLFSDSRVFVPVLRFSPLGKNHHTADSSWL